MNIQNFQSFQYRLTSIATKQNDQISVWSDCENKARNAATEAYKYSHWVHAEYTTSKHQSVGIVCK